MLDIVSRSSRYASHDGDQYGAFVGKMWHQRGAGYSILRKKNNSSQTEEDEMMSHLSVHPPAVEAQAPGGS